MRVCVCVCVCVCTGGHSFTREMPVPSTLFFGEGKSSRFRHHEKKGFCSHRSRGGDTQPHYSLPRLRRGLHHSLRKYCVCARFLWVLNQARPTTEGKIIRRPDQVHSRHPEQQPTDVCVHARPTHTARTARSLAYSRFA